MTTQQVQEAIHTLQAIDPTAPEAYDEAVNAYKHIGKLPFFILDLPNLPINVFHTRTHDTDNYFENIDEIALPPEAAVKYFARCNVPHQPFFIVPTIDRHLTWNFWSIGVEEKKDKCLYVTIGKWTIENSLKVLIVTSPHADDRLTPYDKTHGEKLDHFINQQSGEMKAAMILLYKFLFDKFRNRQRKTHRLMSLRQRIATLLLIRSKTT